MAFLCTLFIMTLMLVINMDLGESANVTFGGCESENDSCTECYHKLKELLLKRDDNIRSLSVAFFPPKHNLPEFVTVTYCFDHDCNKTKTWYWTHDSSYLFFPIETFQYLSLFFGKPATLFSQRLKLYLDEECYNASTDMLDLLTQRLKNFIQRASFDPVIDDNYFARAQENDINDILLTPIAKYILSFYICGVFVAISIVLLLLTLYLNTKRWDLRLKKISETKKLNKYAKSKIFSVAVTAFLVNLLALALDVSAIVTIKKHEVPIYEPFLDALPYWVTAVDSFGLLICLVSVPIICYSHSHGNDREYMVLALSTLGPVISLFVHLPYIAIAYLNDASYATSIFIYYTVTVFIVFGTLDLTYGTCQSALIHAARLEQIEEQIKEQVKQIEEQEKQIEEQEEQIEEQPHTIALLQALIQAQEQVQQEGCYKCCPKKEHLVRHVFVFAIPAFVFFILIFVGMITAALVLIPISKAFSDIPNRLLGFYQTAVVVIGAYVFYRVFFKKKPSIHKVVRERKKFIPTDKVKSSEDWNRLSKDERVEEFYSRFVDIISSYEIPPNQQDDSETDDE